MPLPIERHQRGKKEIRAGRSDARLPEAGPLIIEAVSIEGQDLGAVLAATIAFFEFNI